MSNEFWAQQQQYYLQAQSSVGFFGSLLGTLGGAGAAYMCAPDSDGWYDYVGNPAPKDKLCQFKQGHEENEGEPWVGYASEFRPEMNVAYLKWKLTGIGKETP